MPFEFEALVGHLYVVGGRAISAPPPGALVEVSPRKAARGREADTFFALVLPSGDALAPTAFYDQMAHLAAERYFSSTGSVTSGLRNVFNNLNQNLFDHNQSGKRPYEANLICAVLRGSDLILGRVGPAVVALRHDMQTHTFPEDLSNDEALYTAPLGVHPVPNVRMTQYRVGAGSRLVLADANLADLDHEKLLNALVSSDLSMVLVAFKELARLQLTLMAVEFVPPDEPALEALPVGESTTEIVESLRPAAAKARKTDEVAQADTGPAPAPAAPARGRFGRRKRGGADDVTRQVQRSVGMTALGLARVFSFFNRALDRLFPPPKEGQKRFLGSPASMGMVVLLPALVVGLVVVMWLAGAGESEYELCLQETRSRVDLARSIPSNERETVLNAWNHALSQIATCERQRPSDPMLTTFRREGQFVIDTLEDVQRRETISIETFFGANLTRIVAQGQDLYVLDSTASQVYRVQLSPDGRSRSRAGLPIREMRRGAVVNGRQIADIIDIAFSEESNVIMALDANGVLISCTPSFLQCTAQQLLGVENWSRPVAMTTWTNGRLYVLDTGVGDGQIWRYVQSGGTFASPPSEYFGSQRPNLRGAVDFAIDDRGAVYVLLADGTLNRYLDGVTQPFNYANFPIGQQLTSADAMYLDNNPTGQLIYIASRARGTVYQVSLTGTFWASYRAFDETLFAGIAGVIVTPQDLVYVVSGNAILAFQKSG